MPIELIELLFASFAPAVVVSFVLHKLLDGLGPRARAAAVASVAAVLGAPTIMAAGHGVGFAALPVALTLTEPRYVRDTLFAAAYTAPPIWLITFAMLWRVYARK